MPPIDKSDFDDIDRAAGDDAKRELNQPGNVAAKLGRALAQINAARGILLNAAGGGRTNADGQQVIDVYDPTTGKSTEVLVSAIGFNQAAAAIEAAARDNQLVALRNAHMPIDHWRGNK